MDDADNQRHFYIFRKVENKMVSVFGNEYVRKVFRENLWLHGCGGDRLECFFQAIPVFFKRRYIPRVEGIARYVPQILLSVGS